MWGAVWGPPKGYRCKGGIPGLSHAPLLLPQLGGFPPGTVGGDQHPGPVGKVPARSPLRSQFLRLMVNPMCPLENNLTRFWQCSEWGGAAGSRLWLWVGAAAAPTGPGGRRTDVRTPPLVLPLDPCAHCPLPFSGLQGEGLQLLIWGHQPASPPTGPQGPWSPSLSWKVV